MKAKFSVDDKVFAKVRGYPYWPAKVIRVVDDSTSRVRYEIVFYGSAEKAVVKGEDVQPFLERRHDLGKARKQKAFNDAMTEIVAEFSSRELEGSGGEPKDGPSEETGSPVPSKKSGRKSGAGSSPIKAETSGTDGKSPRGRKRKSKAAEETGAVSSPELVSKRGRKIKPAQPYQDSPVSAAPRPPNRSDKLQDLLEFHHNGEKVSIALNVNRPPLYCPKSTVDWNKTVLAKAEELKDKIINYGMPPDEAVEEMKSYTRSLAKDKKKEYEENAKQFKILKTEGKLLQFDVKLKKSLTLNQANPYEACKLLDEITALPITALMLKKHPEIVDTFKKLSRYVGNASNWGMSEEDLDLFRSHCEAVREKSQTLMEKIKHLFEVSEGQCFSRIFSNQLREFNRATERLSQEDFYLLVKDKTAGLEE